MKHKIVIIKGKVTAGKSTTSYELAKVLPGWIFVDAWKIKEMFEPLDLKDRTPLKTISKDAMALIMKKVIEQMQINILIQESSIRFVKKKLGNLLKKYDYEIYSFFLDVEYDDAVKRDIEREKPTMNLSKHKKEEWKSIKAQPEKGDIVINTSEMSIREVRDFILKNIDEKPKKNKNASLIRRCW